MALTINSWSFDQPIYNSGDTITLTVNYTSTDTTGGVTDAAFGVTVDVNDTASTASATSTGAPEFPTFVVASGSSTEAPDPTTVTATDNRPTPGTWTLVSKTFAAAAPFTAVAVLTSVA